MVTYADPFIRFTASGVLGGANGAEIWANNISCYIDAVNEPITRASMEAVAAAKVAAFSTFYAGSCTNQVRLTNLRAALVQEDGKVARDSNGAYLQGDAVVNTYGTSTISQPLDVAVAVSLQSDFEGPTGRGRFYVPCPNKHVALEGRWVAADAQVWADRAYELLAALDLGITAGLTLTPVIASGGSAQKGIPPGFRDITSIKVGRVPDRQSRRRVELDEGYVVRTYPT